MERYLRHIAILLLLLFCRAMVPDAILLQLHSHTHTVHITQADTKHAQLGQKHKHCPVEDLFGAPCHSAQTSVAFTPVVHTTAHVVSYSSHWHRSVSSQASLRGPPIA
ncbi:hypothetical protein ACSX1A_15950 [Pontibacter sp. MBLB2868]|uniref:hypothetical protein n=1 Tax=Pontibacter sp. MBLB2868 TaxID=3451555 RepID=UPI003F753D03